MTKSKKAEALSEPQQPEPASDQAIEAAPAGDPSQAATEPFPPTTDTTPAAGPQKKPFQVVRGWTSRNKPPVQYRKLTDADLGIIFFKFVLPKDQATLPPDIKDILDAHKRYPDSGEPTGLHFENSAKHGKVWIIKNTAEGRAIADKIDFALQKLAEKYELQAKQSAAR